MDWQFLAKPIESHNELASNEKSGKFIFDVIKTTNNDITDVGGDDDLIIMHSSSDTINGDVKNSVFHPYHDPITFLCVCH